MKPIHRARATPYPPGQVVVAVVARRQWHISFDVKLRRGFKGKASQPLAQANGGLAEVVGRVGGACSRPCWRRLVQSGSFRVAPSWWLVHAQLERRSFRQRLGLCVISASNAPRARGRRPGSGQRARATAHQRPALVLGRCRFRASFWALSGPLPLGRSAMISGIFRSSARDGGRAPETP